MKVKIIATSVLVINLGVIGLSIISSMIPVETSRKRKESAIERFVGDRYIASVIEASAYPHTLAAMAKVESDFRPQIKGDKGDSHGLYQIQAKHHGEFDKTIEGQTRKAEQVLSALIKRYGYSKAIEKWNGSGTKAKAYKKKVLYYVKQIKQIEQEIKKEG